MLYRPKFCCNCGDAIERAEWRFLTSRRFCDLCSTEFVPTETIPRIIVGLACVVIVAGIGGFLFKGDGRSGGKNSLEIRKPVSVGFGARDIAGNASVTPSTPKGDTASVSETGGKGESGSGDRGKVASGSPNQGETEARNSFDPGARTVREVYYCGAITRKGTPCTRRVKTKGPCWQHAGKTE
jgi:hypothetical protein